MSFALNLPRGKPAKLAGFAALGCFCLLVMAYIGAPIDTASVSSSVTSLLQTGSIDTMTLSRNLDDGARNCARGTCGEQSEHFILYTTPSPITSRRVMQTKHKLQEGPALIGNHTTTVFEGISRFVHAAAPKTKPNQIFFSLATSPGRLNDPVCPFKYWTQDSNVHVLFTVPIDDPPDSEGIAETFFKDLGLASYHIQRADTYIYGDAWSNSLPRMVKIATENKYDITHYTLMDDDTFITSLVNFRHILDEHDPNVQRYIGAPSEKVDMIKYDGGGQGGYGGAGVILTRALALNVAEAWEESGILRYTHRAGDCMLAGAVAFVQGRAMRSPNIYYERSMHQNDIRDLADSLFRAGFRWITLHHWGWFDIFPDQSKYDQMHQVVELFQIMNSEDVFANHLLVQNENETVILTNGYCLTTYSPPLSDLELYRIEDDGRRHRDNIDIWDPTHGPYREWREEGRTKTTQWLTSIEPKVPGADVYYMMYETIVGGPAGRGTGVAWVYK